MTGCGSQCLLVAIPNQLFRMIFIPTSVLIGKSRNHQPSGVREDTLDLDQLDQPPKHSWFRSWFKNWFRNLIVPVQIWTSCKKKNMSMYIDQCKSSGYGSIPIDTFLVEWTSIYQLFWGSPGVPGFWHTAILFLGSSWLEASAEKQLALHASQLVPVARADLELPALSALRSWCPRLGWKCHACNLYILIIYNIL